MGRLLKKKDSAKQKKKKQADDFAPENGQSKPEASGQVSTGGQSAVIKGLPQKKPIIGTAKAAPKGEKNFIDKSVQFLKEVKIELKKVTWPDRKHTAGSTVVVILVVTIISMILGLMDIGLSSLVKIVLQ
jgi:preprotein translocase subunit SecE